MSTDGRQPALGPATAAARRTQRRRPSPRPYEQPADDDLTGNGVALSATRALLSVRNRTEAAAILLTAIRDLGGAVVPARLGEAHPDALPVDVSLGAGEPLLVVVPQLSIAAMQLGHHLPSLLQDALSAAERCDVTRRQAELATDDALTCVASRRLIAPSLGRARPGDVVCMFDLDGVKELNDSNGHAAGDRALQELGDLLRGSVRGGEFCGRYGGDEFLLILAGAPVETARRRLVDVLEQWRGRCWHGTSASVGIAVVGPAGGVAAGRAADEALLVAKRSGRDRVVISGEIR